MAWKVTNMNCIGDYQRDNNEISQRDVNCLTASFANKQRQLNLHKCKSDSDVRRRSRIDKMGARISRSKSLDNISTESVVYKSLLLNKPKRDERSLCSFDDSEEDYKILESSEGEVDSGSEYEEDKNNCVTIEQCSTVDGRTENRIRVVVDQQHQQTTAGNEIIQNDLSCEKYSTLPRVNLPKGNVEHETFARRSMTFKSHENRGQKMNEVRVKATDNTSDDKTTDFTSARSTTLPKTRSRLSEPFSRHSLRRAIDLTMPRKYSASDISDAPTHSEVIISADNESTSGTGKNVLLYFFCL